MINSISFNMSAIDSNAWTIFIVGLIIVFAALIALSILFYYLPIVINFKKLEQKGTKKKEKVESKKVEKKIISSPVNTDGEVYAAIAMAVNLYINDMHDDDSMVLTINRDSIMNSSWNSKIQNVNLI
jgi:glutaconyl-CoA/methylmalonyl-CoA decarboxylase subunit delta